ncbi:putative heterokaryon incompatibility protein [Botrytis fragariae]|uniref:Putative heterokaryon incompatibility protein n=1 Tax=Botrytis fragariae TaxID=1964551 RepID=A0A8H6B312_9HELO|nr:putative heterokaryon incompatibility protein [Botrytis fragariae]KAF5878112.1 putative heterokaryon incompatibility protein [Botrytis fragariae]
MVLSSNRKILVDHHDVTNILDLVSIVHNFLQIDNRIPAQYLIEPDVLSRIRQLSLAMQTYRTALKSICVIPGTNREFKFAGQNGLNLGELLARFRGKKSTLPMDQVYCVLGMTIDSSIMYKVPFWTSWSRKRPTQRLPRFDHRQSLRNLCTDTARYILKEDGDLGALRMNNAHAYSTKDTDWPSWVPDFSSPLPGPGEPKSMQWNLESSTFPQNMNKLLIDKGSRLVVHGHVLGEIEGLVGITQKNGEYSDKTCDRQSELKKENLWLSQYRDGFGFLPLAVSRDSEGRHDHDHDPDHKHNRTPFTVPYPPVSRVIMRLQTASVMPNSGKHALLVKAPDRMC